MNQGTSRTCFQRLTERLEVGPFPKPTLVRAFPKAENR